MSELKWKLLSPVRLYATPWTTQSREFSRPEYWSGWPFPSPGDLPNPGIEPRSPALQADSLPAEPPGKPKNPGVGSLALLQRLFLPQESGSPAFPRDSLPTELSGKPLVRMAIIEKPVNNKHWAGGGVAGYEEKETLLHCWWDCKLLQSLWRTAWGFFKTLTIELPYDPGIPVLGIYPEQMKMPIWKECSGLQQQYLQNQDMDAT